MAVCDTCSVKSDIGNLRRVEILPYFDTHSMDESCEKWCVQVWSFPAWKVYDYPDDYLLWSQPEISSMYSELPHHHYVDGTAI